MNAPSRTGLLVSLDSLLHLFRLPVLIPTLLQSPGPACPTSDAYSHDRPWKHHPSAILCSARIFSLKLSCYTL